MTSDKDFSVLRASLVKLVKNSTCAIYFIITEFCNINKCEDYACLAQKWFNKCIIKWKKRKDEYIHSCLKCLVCLFYLLPHFVLRDQHKDPFGWYSDTNHAKFYAVHVRWGRNNPPNDNRLLFKVPDLPFWLCWFVHNRPVC